MGDRRISIEIVSCLGGQVCLGINGIRVAGPKPMGRVLYEWSVSIRDIRNALMGRNCDAARIVRVVKKERGA